MVGTVLVRRWVPWSFGMDSRTLSNIKTKSFRERSARFRSRLSARMNMGSGRKRAARMSAEVFRVSPKAGAYRSAYARARAEEQETERRRHPRELVGERDVDVADQFSYSFASSVNFGVEIS